MKAAGSKAPRQVRHPSGTRFVHLRVLRAFVVEISCCLACLAAAQAATIEAGPEAAPGIRAIASLTAYDLGPGTIIRLHAGHYTAPILVPLNGTEESPITIEGDGPIDIDGSIVLEHAAFITVRHLHIVHASDAGIILREGSHDILVSGNIIEHTKLGIWLGDGVGAGIRILNNVISFSTTHGIALDGVKGEPAGETVIGNNEIKNSGIHGIEIHANSITIGGNKVSGSGRLSTGASGIHVFAKDAEDGFGKHNIIDSNESFDNHDTSAQDGNGIQLDQWCDNNFVTANIIFNNDGAGISVFDAAGAIISGNTLRANMRDPGRSHRHKGELVFASDDEHNIDHTRRAKAGGNFIIAANPEVAAILVDVPTSLHPPMFSNNSLYNTRNGPIARWAGRDITSITAWNALAPHTEPDRVSKPKPG